MRCWAMRCEEKVHDLLQLCTARFGNSRIVPDGSATRCCGKEWLPQSMPSGVPARFMNAFIYR